MLDLLLPQRCAVCGAAGVLVCDGCAAGFPRVRAPLCERCGAPTAWPVARCTECTGRRIAFAKARAALVYDADVRRLVSSWKERGLRTLAAFAADVVAEALDRPRADTLVFVPPDRARGRERGHHPAERLTRELGSRWQLPVLAALHRTRSIERQAALPLSERRRNVARAFAARAPVPRAVCLVDDVYTTGATASAAASALRAGGARRVEVVTFARAVRG